MRKKLQQQQELEALEALEASVNEMYNSLLVLKNDGKLLAIMDKINKSNNIEYENNIKINTKMYNHPRAITLNELIENNIQTYENIIFEMMDKIDCHHIYRNKYSEEIYQRFELKLTNNIENTLEYVIQRLVYNPQIHVAIRELSRILNYTYAEFFKFVVNYISIAKYNYYK